LADVASVFTRQIPDTDVFALNARAPDLVGESSDATKPWSSGATLRFVLVTCGAFWIGAAVLVYYAL
jgi:hypothetical protein